jgi:hypothetical protein
MSGTVAEMIPASCSAKIAMALPFRPPPGLELPPPPGFEGFQKKEDADADALSACSTADTSDMLESGVEDEFTDAGYVPGRLLQCIAHETPEPIRPGLEKCAEQPTSMIPPPPAPVFAFPLPSVGSAGHACGLCQPCEFFHKNRCTAGASCRFCHLCGAQEPKARRKAKNAIKRMYRLQREMEER